MASLLLVLGVGATLFAQPISRLLSRSPRLELDESLIDLGEYAPGEYETTITIRNAGGQPLTISRVESSCSCAVVTKPATVAPFSEEAMEVSFNVAPGRGYANFTIHSNDEKIHDIALKWLGSAQPLLVPRAIVRNNAALGEPYECTVSVVYPGGRTAVVPELESAASKNGHVEVEVMRSDPTAFRTASDLVPNRTIGYLDLRVHVRPPVEAGMVADTCFAEPFRRYMRQAKDRASPEFFVVSAFEALDRGMRVQDNLLQLARFRAIESRRAFVRNAEAGYSGIIDGNGTLLAKPPGIALLEPAILGRIPIDERFAPYSVVGDWLPALSWVVILVGIAPIQSLRARRTSARLDRASNR